MEAFTKTSIRWTKSWLVPPSYPGDAVQTNRAAALHVFLLTYLGMLLLIFLGTLVSGFVTFFVLVMDGIAFSVSLGLLLALHHGWFRLARLGLIRSADQAWHLCEHGCMADLYYPVLLDWLPDLCLGSITHRALKQAQAELKERGRAEESVR